MILASDSVIKNSPAHAGNARDAGQADPLEMGVAAHFCVLAWETPRTEEPGGNSPWGRTESA